MPAQLIQADPDQISCMMLMPSKNPPSPGRSPLSTWTGLTAYAYLVAGYRVRGGRLRPLTVRISFCG